MRRTRLTTMLVAIPLAAVACGTATSTGVNPGGPVKLVHGTPQTARSYAAALLARVQLPADAVPAAQAPSKALDRLPESPSLSKAPTVLKKFWTVDQSASAVYAWLKQHGPGLALLDAGRASVPSSEPASPATQFLGYQQTALPSYVGAGYLYLAVVSTGPTSSAIGAYAVTLAQPPRLAVERIPSDLSKAVVGWSLAAGGTPVEKVLTGAAAAKLARDFNSLKVATTGMVACPMIPTRYGDVSVTFTADGHTWHVDIPACPDIQVTRDGKTLPPLSFGNPFLADVKAYTGYLPQAGPPQASGGVIPLVQPPSHH